MKTRRRARPTCIDCGSPMMPASALPTIDQVLATIPEWQWRRLLANPWLMVLAQAAMDANDVLRLVSIIEQARTSPVPEVNIIKP